MKFVQNLQCGKWQFNTFPEFNGGQMSSVFANCGKGVLQNGSSFMHTFFGVKDLEIISYTDKLKALYELCYFKETDGNLFYQFKADSTLLYISYLKSSETARFILEEGTGVSVCDFGYNCTEKIFDNTVFSQYSLHYDAMIKGTTCDCGMNYIFRLHDGSVIIIDGGEMEQSTDIALADYWEFLKEITEKNENEKIRVSMWLCTHAHNDHADFFGKLLLLHGDELTVERMAFDFPLNENTAHSPSMTQTVQRIIKNNPNVKYLKLHSGMTFNICNAQIDIYCSGEEAVDVYDGVIFPGLNDTSISFSVTADGNKAVFLADMGERNGKVFIESFKGSVKNTVFLQAAHHGINSLYNIYEQLNTKFLFLPQCKMNMETRFPDTFEHFIKLFGCENILLAHDKTDIFILKDSSFERKSRKHVGCQWDNSEW